MYYIYIITNSINGKTYIGQRKYNSDKYSDDYESLISDGYYGSGLHIKSAIKKYGKEFFSKDILVSHLECKEAADEAEKYYISCYRDLGKAEYNIAAGGGGVSRPCSEETKRKISVTCKGRTISSETRRKMSETRQILNNTEKYKKKVSVKIKGRHWFNNGEISIMDYECPAGYRPGRFIPQEKLEEQNKAKIGTHWFNNGEKNVRVRECPDGFRPGKIHFKQH